MLAARRLRRRGGTGRTGLNAALTRRKRARDVRLGPEKGMETPASMDALLEIREEILDGENPCGE